jgi:hypothetical protein
MSFPSQETLIGIGRTAEIYAWQEHQVIKLFHAECPPELAEYEAMKSRMISSMNIPTPRFFGMVELDGRKGLIYERVYGISMLKMVNMRPWLLFRLARQQAELHHTIHQQDGAGFPSIRPDLDAAIQWMASFPGIPADKVIKLLKALPDGHALCHLDFHPDQVIMTTRGPVILDWATAYHGHPLADVARTVILFKVGQLPYGGRVMQAFINLWRSFFLETYLDHYFKLDPLLHRRDLTPWLIPAAVGRLNEKIAGERDALFGVITSNLAELGMAPPQSSRSDPI